MRSALACLLALVAISSGVLTVLTGHSAQAKNACVLARALQDGIPPSNTRSRVILPARYYIECGQPVPADAVAPPAAPSIDRNKTLGFSLTIPVGWSQPTGVGVIGLPSPGEILLLESRDPGARIDGRYCPLVTVDANQATALIRIIELRTGPHISSPPRQTPRPATFGPSSGQDATSSFYRYPPGCPTLQPTTQEIFFSDQGRAFQALVTFYPDAPAQRRAESYEILNSLRFVAASRLPANRFHHKPFLQPTLSSGGPTTPHPPARRNGQRSPSQVLVFVQNASGVLGTAAAKANMVRGLGYAIVGTGNGVTLQTGTTVGCKAGFAKEAHTLAKAIGPTTTIAPFPKPAPANATNANCIVTVGKQSASSSIGVPTTTPLPTFPPGVAGPSGCGNPAVHPDQAGEVVPVEVPCYCPSQPITAGSPAADPRTASIQAAAEYFQRYAGWNQASIAVRAVYRVGDTTQPYNGFAGVFARNVPEFCGRAVADASYGVELFYSDPDFQRAYGAVDALGDVVVAHFAIGWRVWGVFHGPVASPSG